MGEHTTDNRATLDRNQYGLPNIAALAHLVEHVPEEHGVLGSSPRGGTMYLNRIAFGVK